MSGEVNKGDFKPVLSRIEAKSDITTRTAMKIINDQLKHREAKTERLRAARIAQEAASAADPVVPEAKVAKKRVKRLKAD